MAYTLKLTNGKILLTLPDQTSDSVSTSLTLIGKNVNAYGTDINQNYIRILENFANSTEPVAPLQGQLWFDTVTQKIKVYTVNNEFKQVGSPIISATKPNTLTVGDLWYDTTTSQLKFQKDPSTIVVIGPEYTSSSGKSGWIQEIWQTNTGNTSSVLSLYSNNNIIGVASNVTFSVAPSDPNYINFKSIKLGYNARYDSTLKTKFIGTATSAESLTDSLGRIITPEQVIIDNKQIDFSNSVRVFNNFSIGTHPSSNVYVENFKFSVVNNVAVLKIAKQEQPFQLQMNSFATSDPALHLDSVNGRVGVFTTTPKSEFSVKGDVTIDGNLFVLGATSNVESQDLLILDNTITLAYSATNVSNNIKSTGGGIILQSFPYNRYIKWFQTADQIDQLGPNTNSSNVWQATDNFELRGSTSTYMIDGNIVLTKDSLGLDIKNALGLENLIVSTSTTVCDVKIYRSGSRETTFGINSDITNGQLSSIVIGDNLTSNINFNGTKLTNARTPTPPGVSSGTLWNNFLQEVATVDFVRSEVGISQNQKIALTIDVTGHATNPEDPELDIFVIQMLGYLLDPNAPIPYDTPSGSRARVLCTRYTTPKVLDVQSKAIDTIPVFVDKEGVQNAERVIQYSPNYSVNIDLPAANLGINRCIKQYTVAGSAGAQTWVRSTYSGTSNTVYNDGTWI